MSAFPSFGIYRSIALNGPSAPRTLFSRAAKKAVTGAPSSASPTQSTGTPGESPGSQLDPAQLAEMHPAIRKFPRFMRKYAVRFVHAPVSHVTAFLIVHELSAIVPLFGLWAIFHHYEFVPLGLPDWLLNKGISFIRVLAERNEWTSVSTAASTSRIIMEGAAAYAAVKVLLPARIAMSLWLMPWFARVAVLPVTGLFSRLFGRNKKVKKNPNEEQDFSEDLSPEVKKKDVIDDPGKPRL